MHKKTVIYILWGAIALLIVLCLIVLWRRNEGFQDISTTTTATVTIGKREDYLYAGYHDLYDFVISSKIVEAIKEIQFEDIPRLYLFVTKADPLKCRVVFSKLKKSPVVINLYKKTLQEVKPDTNKSVALANSPERSSISDDAYNRVIALLNKYNMPKSFSIDMIKEYRGPIQSYFQYMDLYGSMDAYNVLITKEERTKLNIDIKMPSDVEQFTLFNTSFPKAKQGITFTNLLNRDGITFDYITKQDDVQRLLKKYTALIESDIRAFLFNNSRLGTNISPDRIKLFNMDFINTYKVGIFYILQPYTGDMELTNSEFQTKIQSILIPDMDPEQIAVFADKKELNKNTSYIPDSYFYLHYNEFQFIKVIVKKKEN